MDLSFFTSVGGDDAWSLAECAAWGAAHHFDAVRFSCRGLAEPDRVLREGPGEIVNTLRAHGLYLGCLAAHTPLLHADPEERERQSARLIACIDAAAALGVPTIITNTGSPYGWQFYGMPSRPPGNPTDKVDEVLALFRERFTPVVRHAEAKGVKIALDCAVRMGNIACNPEMWERCLGAIPSDALGLSCDPSHLVWLHISPVEDAIRAFKGKWYYADVKDCEISPSQLFRQGVIGNWWWQYRVCGRGQLNWATIIGALTDAGYDGILCVENEDRAVPGVEGLEIARRHLVQFLPPKEASTGARPPAYGASETHRGWP